MQIEIYMYVEQLLIDVNVLLSSFNWCAHNVQTELLDIYSIAFGFTLSIKLICKCFWL